jgi:DNA-binding LacI/PurR family transcriptional regulator
MGLAAADLLLDCLAEPSRSRQVLLEPTLIVRGSTMALR